MEKQINELQSVFNRNQLKEVLEHSVPSFIFRRIRPALLRQASYGTLKIGCYHMFKRLTVENPEDETLLVNVICGVSAGILSSAVCTPTDVLKVNEVCTQSCVVRSRIN